MSNSRTNLDEVVAPAPIHTSPEKPSDTKDYLDNRNANEDREAPPSLNKGDRVPKEQASNVPSGHHASDTWRTIYIVSHLTFFSFLGTLLRIAVECLTFYPGAPIATSVLWANVGGSMVMGFLSEDKNLFLPKKPDPKEPDEESNSARQRVEAQSPPKKTIPLYIGLTTGFCGSFTSFSTFIRDIFLATINSLPVPLGQYPALSLFATPPATAKAPSGGFSFMAILAVLFSEIGLSLVGLFLGAHLAIAVSPWTPSLPRKFLNIVNPLIVILAFLSWVAVICLVILLPDYGQDSTIWSAELWRGPVLFSLVFSPLGCLARFFLSLKLNARMASFPLGTFVANVAGTMVLGMAYSLQHASISVSTYGGGSIIGCQVLQGIMDGFCGCLTTVSTWVLELSGLRRRHAYIYGAISVVVAYCALVVEIGSLKWSIGLTTPVCFAE
ncbi:unnamed protein product [Penicillium salamii]|uniref:CrcB-like protein-domain-containing protein n=1 Tax=Penicillium salamii TaxID=1612424 RepID=A0A9W4NQB6_9EURO|nr:unnamed protein product [Penicillium salamii]CAG8114048.1 unnamed protein product [Penicillium salamii]CAG8127426.1 unnamed protein product [Penicillium salamii]CAG8262033.1 unnamed protein product [Penicillium salamii]CAG8274612.1 unnamed protein product [Penicillium salamii]